MGMGLLKEFRYEVPLQRTERFLKSTNRRRPDILFLPVYWIMLSINLIFSTDSASFAKTGLILINDVW